MLKFKNKKYDYSLKAVLEEDERKKEQNTKNSTTRMAILIGLISFCIVLLIGRVYYISVHKYKYYSSKLLIYQTTTYTSSVPRGSIYDRNGNELVSTKSTLTIMYYPVKSVTDDQELEMAQNFVNVIDVDISNLSLRDKKDYFILYQSDKAEELITDDEWDEYYAGDLNDNEIYNLKLERITEDMINETWSEEELKVMHVYYLMNKNGGDPSTIVEGITETEASYIAEHNDQFRGFYVSYSYERVYQFSDLFKNVFGKVSSSTQGIPQEKSDYYLASDYQMTSSVGTSGLEEQYEDLLSGTPNEYTIDYDDDGNAVQNDVSAGQKGYNLTMTVDWDLEEYLNERITYYLSREAYMSGNQHFDRILVTMIDPNTGEVLAMAGKYLNRSSGTIYDYPEGNYLEAFACGSSVKGATLYSGYKYGAVSFNEYMMDTPLQIKDTPVKGSWQNLGYINDLDAIAYSSNVYMMHIVIRIGNGNYVPNQPISVSFDAFKKLRESFGELGLGVLTGLDVPDEELGMKGRTITVGNLLDFAIGQYDTYTNIQLAQYISTIANGGRRLQPYLIKDAWYNDNGEKIVIWNHDVVVLDDLSQQYSSQFARIRLAMQGTVSYGTVHGAIDSDLMVAGKTGTAEVTTDGDDVMNRVFVGFAPYDNPRIAYACIAPNQETVEGVSSCILIANEAFRWYKNTYGY